jgi:hypothetical protein
MLTNCIVTAQYQILRKSFRQCASCFLNVQIEFNRQSESLQTLLRRAFYIKLSFDIDEIENI